MVLLAVAIIGVAAVACLSTLASLLVLPSDDGPPTRGEWFLVVVGFCVLSALSACLLWSPVGHALDRLVDPMPGDLLGSRRFAAWCSVTIVTALTGVAILRRRKPAPDEEAP